MKINLAKKLMAAAELAFEGTAFDEADLLVRHATRMARDSVRGKVSDPNLMRAIDDITARSCRLRADLQTARRAGLWHGRGPSVVSFVGQS